MKLGATGLFLKTTVLILALSAIFTTTGAAASADIYVNETGWWYSAGGEFNTSSTPIQFAINNASAGATIYVYNGSYSENVKVDKKVILLGEGADVVTVNAADPSDHVFEVTANHVNISGFNATGANGYLASGFFLGSVEYCDISDNIASNNNNGIYLSSSSDNTLTGNTANSNNYYGIWLDGSSGNTLTGNNANSNKNGIMLIYSSNNMLTDNTANLNNKNGIWVARSSGNTLTGNTANSNNDYGIYLPVSSGNTLTSNTANSNNYLGIRLSSSNDNTLTGNTANLNNYHGIWLYVSSGNTLTGNTANSNNHYGIYLFDLSGNTLTGNTANSNNDYGIYLSSSSNNLIYNNYFNNTNNAYDPDGINIWNTTKTGGVNIVGGTYLGGNYWSDYGGADTDEDGLGDTNLPYKSFITNGGDCLPLVMPSGPTPPSSDIPEFPTIALPILAVIGILFIMLRRRG